ncbi:hypothetical protein [Bacteroides sp. 224]|uniref:hypothetical protein n=1 Tax=Bacteroides sp. 224 TaxID=2302936 RepID=UPI0013D4CC85|nr:hypothetical protein [Bacteroides sp. 224]NDV65127.1 hypothetical protein [Bacteroides sp. 224]
MRLHLFFTSLLCSFQFLLAQTPELTQGELNQKLDSILMEGNQLFLHERASWTSYDLALENPKVKEHFESYLTYETRTAIKTIIIGYNDQKCIAEYTFTEEFTLPSSTKIETRDLTSEEKKLIEIRYKLMEQLDDDKYNIRIAEGFSLNFILLPFKNKYKFYILTGTAQPDVIPFGNDYLVIADKDGKIERFQKFHVGLFPNPTTFQGKTISEMVHSHSKNTPFITATDVCTFMLYAPIYDIKSFAVYSPALDLFMKYTLNTNTITLESKDSVLQQE